MKSPPVSVLLQTQHNLLLLQRPTVRHGRTNWRWRCQGLYLPPAFLPPTLPPTTAATFSAFSLIIRHKSDWMVKTFFFHPLLNYLHKMYPQLSLSRSFVLLAVFCSVLSCFVARGIIYLSPFWQPSIVHTSSPSPSLMLFLVVLVVFIPVSDHHHQQQQRNLLSSSFSALPSSLKCNGRHLKLRESLERHEDRCTFE